jgi:hypothetical protein
MAIENLTTYTAVGSAGVFTLDSSAATFTAMRRDDVSYAYYDFGVGHFSDFDIDFEMQITAVTGTISQTILCSVSNIIGTFNDQFSGNDGIVVYAYGNSNSLDFRISDQNTDNTEAYNDGGTSSDLLYCSFKRNGTIATLDIHSDSARTSGSLIDALSITCETGAKQYLYVLVSRDSGASPADSATGYTQNFEINFNSSSSSSSSISSSSSLSSSSLSSSSLSSSSSSSSISSSSLSSSSISSSSVSSSSRSSSSSSTCTGSGDIALMDDITVGSDSYADIWGDGNYIYVAGELEGLRSFSVDHGSGVLTHVDTDDQGNSYNGVWGDGNFIYVANSHLGLRSYSVDENGILTPIHLIDQGDNYQGVWGDGTFIYCACDNQGLRSYSVDGAGFLTFKDVDDQGSIYKDVWGDGNFIYVASTGIGILSYSVDGAGNLNHISTQKQGGGSNYQGVWGDGNFIYVANQNEGMQTYSVDESGNLSYVTVLAGGQPQKVWGDGTFIYCADLTQGFKSHVVDGSGNLTLLDTNTEVDAGLLSVWGDGKYVYVGKFATGTLGSYLIDDCSSSSSNSLSSSSSSSSLSSSSSSSSSSLSSSSSSSSLSSSSSSSSLSSSSSSLSSSSTPWKKARIRRRYKGSQFENCGLTPADYYELIKELEDRFILSSSSASSSSISSSSESFSSSSRSSSSSSISSISSSSSSVSSSSSSVSSSSSSRSSSSSSSSLSSSSLSSISSSSISSSSISSSSDSSSSSLSSSSSSESFSSSSTSSSSFSCFITPNDDFDQPDGTVPDVQRWTTVGNMIVSGEELIIHVDDTTNLSKATTRWLIPTNENFDVQTDWRELSIVSGSGWNVGFEVLQFTAGSRGTRVYKRAHTTTITEEMVSGGVVIDSTNVSAPITSGGFRITRVGDDWQSYYWNGSTWVAIGGPYTVQTFEEVDVSLYVQNYTGTPIVSAAFDNFLLVSGGFICPGSSSSSSSSVSSSSSSLSSSSSSSSSSLSSSSSSSVSSSSSSSSISSSSQSSSSESESLSISTSSP